MIYLNPDEVLALLEIEDNPKSPNSGVVFLPERIDFVSRSEPRFVARRNKNVTKEVRHLIAAGLAIVKANETGGIVQLTEAGFHRQALEKARTHDS